MTINLPLLQFSDVQFFDKLELLVKPDSGETFAQTPVDKAVADIIEQVRHSRDKAVISFTRQFDNLECSTVSELELSQEELQRALESISREQREALETAHKRIERYHQEQSKALGNWELQDEFGHRLGQQQTAIGAVGMYVPGGKASYPSSVLMNAVPAKVAGVETLVMTVPTPGGEKNPLVLAAASLAGVDRVFTIGGAQAIAALAYGTETIPAVDKIVGPGNQYVASAKKQLFGRVGIDMIAGPSEILIYCDGLTDPDWIAMDLFSQAEHDEMAQSILISTEQSFFDKVQNSIEKLLPQMERADVIRASLEGRGAFIKVESDEEALKVIDYIAPEHLELSLEDEHASKFSTVVKNAGAIFVGRASAESFGDYCAGSNHVLPTNGSARFSSPLGVYDFLKRTSIVHLNSGNIGPLADTSDTLARAEGLGAHALSARLRKSE